MDPRTALVLFKDRVAGRLDETPSGGSVFTYLPEWTETIAVALPVSIGRFAWVQGLHPVFQNLGAEGWLRQYQARAGRVAEEDDFGLLLRHGGDCIGAISIAPEAALSPLPSHPFPSDVAADAAAGAGRTVSGVQRKLLVYRDGDTYRPAGPTGPATHIAKFAPQIHPDLVRNEFFSLRLAAEILGKREVTGFELATVDGIQEIALVVERFDRTPDGKKLRLEDFAQVLSRPYGRDFHGKYQGSYEEVAKGISTHSARPQIDLDRFFKAVVFNLLIGNADAHLKNWSLLERSEGLRLSPLYDLLNTLIYAGNFDRQAALTIGDEKLAIEDIDRARIEAFGAAIALPPRAVREALEFLRKRFAASTTLAPPTAESPDGFCNRYVGIVRASCARIL